MSIKGIGTKVKIKGILLITFCRLLRLTVVFVNINNTLAIFFFRGEIIIINLLYKKILMKKFLMLSVFSLLLGANIYAQDGDVAPAEGPVMDMESVDVDYGTIDQHSDPLRKVNFTNTGTEPLVIKNARGSCGCTVPLYPKEPIMPGESDVIEIRYDTKRLGPFSKTVKITTNEGNDPIVLKVHGKVLKPEDQDGVPAAAPGILGNPK